MFLAALFLVTGSVADKARCQASYDLVERRVAEFQWILRRAEQSERITHERARMFRQDALLAVRPALEDLRRIAPYAPGDVCEDVADNGIAVLVDDVLIPYREMVSPGRP